MNRSPGRSTALLAVLMTTACARSEAASSPVLTSDAGEELNPSFAPDAEAVVYSKLTGPGNSDIFLLELGEAPVNLTPDSPVNDTEPGFSPDGSMVAFRSVRDGGGIFVVPAEGGPARKVADEGFDPSWTPDGAEIVYSSASGALTPYNAAAASALGAVNVATGAKRRIGDGYGLDPRVSPDGQRIAFWAIGDRHNGNQRDIWTVKLDGTDEARITNDTAVDWTPVWSPDGAALYFASDRDGAMKIWRVALDPASGRAAGEPELVSADAGAQIRGQLSMSAEGRLAYIDRTVGRSLYAQDLDPATGQPRGQGRAIPLGELLPAGIRVSPDGRRLLIATAGEEQEDVYVVNADGSELRRLTDDRYLDRAPEWSPDGRRIGFRSDRPELRETRSEGLSSFVMEVDGSGLVQIGDMPGSNGAPVWSPDGRRVVVTSTLRTGGTAMFVMAPDGSGQRELARSVDGLSAPVWSPDSRRIAYAETTAGGSIPFLVDVTRATAAAERLPEASFTPTAWSADGKLLAGLKVTPGRPSAPTLLDLADRTYVDLGTDGAGPRLLPGGSFVVMTSAANTRLQLVDRLSRGTRDLVGVSAPSTIAFDVAPDGRTVFYVVTNLESDIHQVAP